MATVCFLNGHLILREHKTGVHYLHEQVTKRICEGEPPYDIKVAYFREDGSHTRELQKKRNEWLKPYVLESGKPRILSYLLPIEWFFGKNDVYFCDGLMPYTIHKAKRIAMVHDMMVKIYPENYSRLKKLYLNLFFRRLKVADRVVCNSETTKNDVIKYYGIDPARIDVCYCGADSTDEVITDNIPHSQAIDLDKRYLLYLGDMRVNKNLPNTARGFIELCKEHEIDDLYLYLAGKKGGEADQVEEIAKSAGYEDKIKFLGYVDDHDKELLYRNAMAITFVSLYEGFGIPIVEAMQHGKPVITSNCSSMREIGEGAAILVNPQDTESIASGYWDVYSGEYTVDKKAYQEKLDIYNFDTAAKRIDESIRKCLGI